MPEGTDLAIGLPQYPLKMHQFGSQMADQRGNQRTGVDVSARFRVSNATVALGVHTNACFRSNSVKGAANRA